jgi:hypothetical protein
MDEVIYHGTLKQEEGISYIEGSDGTRLFQSETIWDGYVRHWLGIRVRARFLPQQDYSTGRNILILWPAKEQPTVPFIELYYNERLINYPLSLFGHMAINVNGEIFNFSRLINENEILSAEEYFYRPALGEFAPHPKTGRYNIEDSHHPYYDKFGRLFMRSIHVLRIEGINITTLGTYLRMRLEDILNTPDPTHPESYRDFSMFRNNCVTIIRDGLRACGFENIRGILPRELFINAAYHIMKADGRNGTRITMYRMPQLKVSEAPYSLLSTITNPINRILARKLPDYYNIIFR